MKTLGDLIGLCVLALLIAPFALFGLYIVLAVPARWYSNILGKDRKSKKGHHLPTRIRWVNWLYALLCSYFWLPCPRCGRMFGGHEGGGSMGGRRTCDLCPKDSGWFPYGQDTSRYHDGKQWVGDPVKAAYFDLNDGRRPPPGEDQ
jgi:hypothetical protein